jgi:hypothetical protein
MTCAAEGALLEANSVSKFLGATAQVGDLVEKRGGRRAPRSRQLRDAVRSWYRK